jgi:hypothetical protein
MDASQSIPIVISEKLRSSVSSKFTQRHFRDYMKSTHKIKDSGGKGAKRIFRGVLKSRRLTLFLTPQARLGRNVSFIRQSQVFISKPSSYSATRCPFQKT